jgi:hypothetical protein
MLLRSFAAKRRTSAKLRLELTTLNFVNSAFDVPLCPAGANPFYSEARSTA